MKALNPTFLDIIERDERERERIKGRIRILQRREEEKILDQEGAEELKRLLALIPPDDGDKGTPTKLRLVDPLIPAIRESLARTNDDALAVVDPENGRFEEPLEGEKRIIAAVFGLLTADGITVADPKVEAVDPTPGTPAVAATRAVLKVTYNDPRFDKAVARAIGEYGAHQSLFDRVLAVVARSGRRGDGAAVRAGRWVSVARALIARSVTVNHENFDSLVEKALGDEIAASDGGAPSSVEIDFPDLEATSDVLILRNNVLAMQVLYPAWMLEQALFFDVYDKVEELFLRQLLPIGRGPAGDRVFMRWKRSTQRLSKSERLTLYSTCFGAATGDPSLVNQNREFSDLWLRFVSAVSEYTRKITVDDLLRTRTPLSVSKEQVRKAARDLAANLSLHGYGITYNAATEIQADINEIIQILSDEEMRAAYGARDLWQLIEQVAVYELGKMVSTSPARTKATAGAVIIKWLANNADRLSGPYISSILDTDVLSRPSMRRAGERATQKPTDRDLVDACEQWLAVTGTSDDRVSEFAQPTEAPSFTSRPLPIPEEARSLLDSVGISAGYGAARSGGNGSRIAVRR